MQGHHRIKPRPHVGVVAAPETATQKTKGNDMPETLIFDAPQEVVTVTCYPCGDTFNPEHSSEWAVQVEAETGRDFCDRCARRHYVECANCHERIRRDYSHIILGGTRICDSCYEEQYSSCSNCGQGVERGELRYQVYCSNCADEISIFPYNAKPTFEPLGEAKHFYGLELEAEYRGHNPSRLESIARATRNLFPDDFCIIKDDSSISNGFEICTRPATRKIQKKSWARFF